ncbi:MAG: ribokinase [Rhodoferax sp.]|jgi:ribokinase|nr:ribokinase [Rhodoferax sp.]
MILVAGSANLDFVVTAPHIPAPGETVLGHGFTTYPGGKGANQAVACARAAGAPTHMLLALGSDAFAQPLETSLREAGVQMHIVRSTEHATGTAFICVSDDAENAITVAPGANRALAAGDLPPLRGFSHLLMQLETPLATVTAYAAQARAAGVQVVLNAAPAQPLPTDLLAQVDVLVVNQGELAVVADCQGSVAECLERLQVPVVVVTLGSHGCLARAGTQTLVQAAFAVTPVDTTGAGDTFCGVLVAALDRGEPLQAALRQASAAAALACTRAGAQSSIPTPAEVAELLRTSQENTPSRQAAVRSFCGQS